MGIEKKNRPIEGSEAPPAEGQSVLDFLTGSRREPDAGGAGHASPEADSASASRAASPEAETGSADSVPAGGSSAAADSAPSTLTGDRTGTTDCGASPSPTSGDTPRTKRGRGRGAKEVGGSAASGRQSGLAASLLGQLKNGLITENPTFVQLLGMCPTLAVTTSVENGVGMGLAATAVLIMSNLVISLLRKVIPSKVRIASYVVIIAGFVTMIDLLLQAFVPALSKSLGLFIPLIVVNCIILARAEAFASKNGPGRSALDGFSMGLGFTVALTIISAVRELLGAGTLLGHPIFGGWFEPATMMILPPGGFLVLGCLIALVQFVMQRKGARK